MIFNKAFDRSIGQSSYEKAVCGRRQRFLESNGMVSSTMIFRQVPYFFEKTDSVECCQYVCDTYQKEKPNNIFAGRIIRRNERLSRYFIQCIYVFLKDEQRGLCIHQLWGEKLYPRTPCSPTQYRWIWFSNIFRCCTGMFSITSTNIP